MGAAFALAMAPAASAEPPDLPPRPLDSRVVNDGHRWAERWVDPNGTASILDVRALPDAAWTATQAKDMLPLERPARAWYRLRLPQTDANQNWYLSVPIPGINSVSLYQPDPIGPGSVEQWRSGDQIATRQWNLMERYPTFALWWTRDGPSTVYLSATRDIKTSLPLALAEEAVERATHRNANVMLGIYFGVVAGCLFVALLRLSVVRDLGFAFFAVYALISALTQASLTGIGGIYLWPHSGSLANGVSLMLPILMVVGALVVLWDLSALRDVASRVDRLLLILAALGVAAALATLWLPFRASFLLAVSFTAANTLLPLPIFAYAALRGNRFAWWGLLAFLPLLLGAAFPILRNLELIPSGYWTQYGLTIASGFHLPALMLVLEQRRRARGRAGARSSQAAVSDPLTGTATRQLLLERIEQCNRRCARFRQEAALLVVDTMNFQDVVIEHGIEWHDRLLIDIATRITSVARDVDTAARIDNARFALLLEGPMTRAKASSIAGQLVAQGLRFSARLPESVSLEFGVTICMVTPVRVAPQRWLAHALEASRQLETDPGRRIALAQGVPLEPMPQVGKPGLSA